MPTFELKLDLNMKSRLLRILPLSAAAIAVVMLYSCASTGNPSGGPRDEDPPVALRSNPMPYSVNFSGRKVTIDFNELINVKDAFTKVTVSPTSKEAPRVSSSGKRVTVQFADTLQPNTTYSIDFGNAIEDNNEGNKLPGFNLTFSTGPELDTLRISGVVLNARDLEPRQEMLVGIHSNPHDSAFKRLPLERITKTDDRGRFSIRGLKPGKYRVFALGDLNNDFRWDNPAEDIAFYDILVSPSSEPAMTVDSIFDPKTMKLDTVVNREYTRFLPNDLLLNAFNTEYKAQYLTDHQRIDSTRIQLRFNAHASELPEISVIGAERMKDWYILEKSRYNDSLTYWIKPKSLILTDTLRLTTRYLRTDSAKQLSPVNDTLRLITQRPKPVAKKKKKKDEVEDSVPEMKFLDLKILSSSSLDVFAPIVMEFETPLDTLVVSRFRLEQKEDTIWKPAKTGISLQRLDSLNPRKFSITYPWEYGTGYRLRIDSIAATGMYGLFTKPMDFEFTVKKEEDYANLRFVISGLPDSVPAFVELLNRSDSPQRVAKVVNGIALFTNVMPGLYYARVVEDYNGNGEYDTGDFDSGRQPEIVYYFPKKINLRKNWDSEQIWDVNAIAIDLQKPVELRKTKYEDEKRRNNRSESETEEEEEDEIFDPTANPFDPNQKKRRKNNPAGYSY